MSTLIFRVTLKKHKRRKQNVLLRKHVFLHCLRKAELELGLT